MRLRGWGVSEAGRGGPKGNKHDISPRRSLLAEYISSYFDLSEGLMYQSKPSLRPADSSSSSSTRSNCDPRPVRAAFACTRWALDSGTSQSGNARGTSAYSYRSQ